MCAALGVILMRCLECNYILSGLKSQVCPECGAAFDPSNPATYRSERGEPTARHIAIGLALLAFVTDAIAVLVGMSEGGAGWAFSFPCLLANGFLTPFIAVIAGIAAVAQLSRSRGRDSIAWIALILALATGIAALWMLNRSFEAVASV